ncbi:MAG: alpha/beta hydrolase [Dehalococcoidia bacterium]
MTYIVVAIALVGVITVAAVRIGMIERYFIYFPEGDVKANPSQFGLAYEEVTFVASDGVELHGWFVPGQGSETLLWFHGNAGNIGNRLENLKLLHGELGVNVFLFDYRGYGRSHGRPSEQGTYLDAEAALTYLGSRGDVSLERVIYFGRSLGAAVAVEMGIRHPPRALILESAFPSVPYMARRAYPFFPVWPFLRTRYDSQAKIAKVNAPVLMLHGDQDDIIPIEAGRRLFDAAKEPKEFYTIRGAGHNDTYLVGGQAYFDALRRFVERLDT